MKNLVLAFLMCFFILNNNQLLAKDIVPKRDINILEKIQNTLKEDHSINKKIDLKITPEEIKKTEISNIRFSKSMEKVRIVFDIPEDTLFNISKENNLVKLYFSKKVEDTVDKNIAINDDVVKDITIYNGDDSSTILIRTHGTFNLKEGTLNNPKRLYLDFDKDYEYSITKPILEGLTKIDFYQRKNGINQAGHFLEVDPKLYDLRPILGYGEKMGKTPVHKQVASSGAIGGINASYFGNGKNIYGVTKLKGEVVSTFYLNRSAFGIDKEGKPYIGEVNHYANVHTPKGEFTLSGINSDRGKNGFTLYNHFFGDKTPKGENLLEFLIRDNKVMAVYQQGENDIHNDEVLSVTGDYIPLFQDLKVGDELFITDHFNEPWDNMVSILSVGPRLVENGEVHIRTSEEKIGSDVSYGRSPRSAVAILKNGNVLLALVDGRQKMAKGMTLEEFANLLIGMTAVNAINFDGGGSSEIVLHNKILNSPSDGTSRNVATSLGIFYKNLKN